MPTKIFLKHGNGKPQPNDINGPGEIAVDITNRLMYTKDDGGNVIALGADVTNSIIDWGQIENIPETFPPEGHTHIYQEVNNGSGQTLDVKLDELDRLISDLQDEVGSLQGNLVFGGTVNASTQTITGVTQAATDAGFSTGNLPKPPPDGSEGIYFIIEVGGDLDGIVKSGATRSVFNSGDWLVSEGSAGWQGIKFDATISITWDEIGNKPTEFPPEDHNHEISDVNGLEDALQQLPQPGHTHDFSEVVQAENASTYAGLNVSEALDTKASIVSINGGAY